MEYSIIVPVFNEKESLAELYEEILASESQGKQWGELAEILFIDDGSTDGSWSEIESLCSRDERVGGVRFRRNFGKAAALDVGFQKAKGDFVLTMDADLQDDPAEIPGFLEMLTTKWDVVSGWKKVRHDPWHKVFPSRCFNAMVSFLTGVSLHDHNCGMKGYRREIFDEVRLYGELHRFVPVLAAARGYRIGERVIQHRRRQFGSSKYGFARFIKGFLDLLTVKFITGYGQRPQHLLGTIGLLAFGVGGVILTVLASFWCCSRLSFFGFEEPYHLSGRPAVIYSAALMLLGGQLLSVGIIGELILSWNCGHESNYSIQQIEEPRRYQ